MDRTTFTTLLRNELTVPTNLDPLDFLTAIEDAFRPAVSTSHWERFTSAHASPLAYLAERDELDFFGPNTLKAAFGDRLHDKVRGPSRLATNTDEKWMAGLRRRAYQYAVVGYERHTRYQQTRNRAVAVALRRTNRLLYGEASLPPHGLTETLKLRSGLMNKLQAQLLVEHLNRHPESHDRCLQRRPTWAVVIGPEPDSSAKEWLETLEPMGSLMRRESGETAAWRLGPLATSGIATYRMENGLVLAPSQVFSMQPPRIILPPRYVLDCSHPDGATVYMAADERSGVGVRRAQPCEEAANLCELVSESNLRMAESPPGDESRLLRGFFAAGRIHDNDRSSHYALGFNEREAERVMAFLSAAGLGIFRSARLGQGGNFNPLGFEDTAHKKMLTLPGPAPLDIEFFTRRG